MDLEKFCCKSEDTIAAWNLLVHNRKDTSSKLVRVFLGGSDGIQVSQFKGAWYRANLSIRGWRIEYICVNINALHFISKN
jgi:hypothetical protein